MPATETRPALTIADQIAALLGDDGSRWDSDDGRSFDALCLDIDPEPTVTIAGSEHHDRYDDGSRPNRYAFSDGSAIVTCASGWDHEGPTPFSWRGCE